MSEPKQIYQRYSGNIKSDKLTVFQSGTVYKFIYQKFIRTNPSQAERKLGFKPKRNLVSEQVFEFTENELSNIDFNQYPFSHLTDKFSLDTLP